MSYQELLAAVREMDKLQQANDCLYLDDNEEWMAAYKLVVDIVRAIDLRTAHQPSGCPKEHDSGDRAHLREVLTQDVNSTTEGPLSDHAENGTSPESDEGCHGV